jgi:hypothetical protein
LGWGGVIHIDVSQATKIFIIQAQRLHLNFLGTPNILNVFSIFLNYHNTKESTGSSVNQLPVDINSTVSRYAANLLSLLVKGLNYLQNNSIIAYF